MPVDGFIAQEAFRSFLSAAYCPCCGTLAVQPPSGKSPRSLREGELHLAGAMGIHGAFAGFACANPIPANAYTGGAIAKGCTNGAKA